MVDLERFEDCKDERKCFGRKDGKCIVLQAYKGKLYDPKTNPCPFCKPERRVTKDKYYPHRDDSK